MGRRKREGKDISCPLNSYVIFGGGGGKSSSPTAKRDLPRKKRKKEAFRRAHTSIDTSRQTGGGEREGGEPLAPGLG